MDEKGQIYKIVELAPKWSKDFEKFLKHQNTEFRKIFGRDMQGDDPLFFQEAYMGSTEEITEQLVDIMKKAKLPLHKIYAMKKTGLIATEENWHKLTTKDIEDWEEAIDEYHERVERGESPLDENDHPLPQIRGLYEILPKCLMMLSHVRTQILTPITDKNNIASTSSTTLSQLCLKRTEMSMKAVAKIVKNPQHKAEVLNLARSIYENYLAMIHTRMQPQKMSDIFDAHVGLKDNRYEYTLKKDESINKKRAKEKKTGKEISLEIPKREMAKSSDHEEDLQIYDHLYGFLSGYTHTDIGIIFDYPSEMEHEPSVEIPYPEFASEPITYPLLFATLVLDEARKTNIINDETRLDIVRFLVQIIPKLTMFFDSQGLSDKEKDYCWIIRSRLRKIIVPSQYD